MTLRALPELKTVTWIHVELLAVRKPLLLSQRNECT